MSDRDSRFTTHFWKSFKKAMGIRLTMSTAFHPKTDGQSERTIQVLEDMLRASVLDHKGSWEKHKHGKLSSRFIRPFEIVERVGTVAYRLALPPSMLGVHEVFHVSMLWRYTPDPAHVVD